MNIKNTKIEEKKASFSMSKLLENDKNLYLKDKKNLNKGEKYLTPVFSTMTGATYNLQSVE